MGKATCSIEGCERPQKGYGWCNRHYQRWLKHGDPEHPYQPPQPDVCSLDYCDRGGRIVRGLCNAHYLQWTRAQKPRPARTREQKLRPARPLLQRHEKRLCSVDGCNRVHEAWGYCRLHYKRVRRNGRVELLERPVVLCSVGGCERPAKSRQMCDKHYSRWMSTGRLDLRSIEEKFWGHVSFGPGGGCWVWVGARHPHGHGNFNGGEALGYVFAHRYTFGLRNELGEDESLDHLCRNPSCVNPLHLERVDQRTNTLRGYVSRFRFVWRVQRELGEQGWLVRSGSGS